MTHPLWIVWYPDGGEDGPGQGTHYRAESAEDAAQQWAKNYDADDCPLTSNQDHSEVVKVVMVANDPRVHTFAVRAVISVDYYAREVEAQR